MENLDVLFRLTGPDPGGSQGPSSSWDEAASSREKLSAAELSMQSHLTSLRLVSPTLVFCLFEEVGIKHKTLEW